MQTFKGVCENTLYIWYMYNKWWFYNISVVYKMPVSFMNEPSFIQQLCLDVVYSFDMTSLYFQCE